VAFAGKSLGREARGRELEALANQMHGYVKTAVDALREPFDWFDRPPSFMRLLGAEWLFSVLYPGKLPVDLKAQTKAFYQAFLGVKIDDRQAVELLAP
jgi:hypothetical protein